MSESNTLAGNSYFMLVDASRVPDVLQVVYELIDDPEYGQLYEDTAFNDVKDVGPIWVSTEPDSPFWQHWMTTPLWVTSAIVVGFPQGQQREALKQLSSRIEVFSPKGRPLYFRFHSPVTLERMMPHLSDQEKALFWGIITSVNWLVLGEQNEISDLRHYSQEKGESTDSTSFILSPTVYDELKA
ncbi:DUF4123 domain-containing protein [Photobacterium lipolyticum]|uniref:DUF4123 domain-containing protein n=1 Tax=Photobacterium lipolyticum TaxID=266810 RepID=A0A2T3N1M8_9GAMM|nr:DUF4123 domain-containing protein [Photobacterium lipolyticum]PSW06094.1 hypothetical protein C9I89_06175 [Photobacterium lipolyticum]